VDWSRFEPSDFEYDFERDKLFEHRVRFQEAVECFFSDFEVRRNKTYLDRYQLRDLQNSGVLQVCIC